MVHNALDSDNIIATVEFYQKHVAELESALKTWEWAVGAKDKQLTEHIDHVTKLEGVIERDRTALADGVTALKKELQSRAWLTEGRGSYEWDDDRYREEFRAAGDALMEALKPLEKLAADLSNSPKTGAEVAAAREDSQKRIAELEAKIVALEDEAEAKEDQFQNDVRIWEGDCARALQMLANACKFEWTADGAPADELAEHVIHVVSEVEEEKKWALENGKKAERDMWVEEMTGMEREMQQGAVFENVLLALSARVALRRISNTGEQVNADV